MIILEKGEKKEEKKDEKKEEDKIRNAIITVPEYLTKVKDKQQKMQEE